jgi:hypothetical protein
MKIDPNPYPNGVKTHWVSGFVPSLLTAAVRSSISNPRVMCCPPSTKHRAAQYRNSSPFRLFFHQPVAPVTNQSTYQQRKTCSFWRRVQRQRAECRDNEQDNQLAGQGAKGVFGLTFSFGFCPLKAKSQTKCLNLESNFF